MKRNNPEKIKFFLYSVIAMIFIIVAAVFINYRYFSDPAGFMESSDGKPTLSLDTVHHVATKDGVKQWSLNASVVNYYQNKNQAVFKDLTVFLFSAKNDETKLTALTGRLDTETNDIVVSGNVIAVNGDYTLNSEELHFNNEKRIVNSFVPVKIIDGNSQITADTMEANLDTSITILEGNVKGIFRGKLSEDKKK